MQLYAFICKEVNSIRLKRNFSPLDILAQSTVKYRTSEIHTPFNIRVTLLLSGTKLRILNFCLENKNRPLNLTKLIVTQEQNLLQANMMKLQYTPFTVYES